VRLFDAPAAEFTLGLDAHLKTQAASFDPMMAVQPADMEPLPHQISAEKLSSMSDSAVEFTVVQSSSRKMN